MRWGFNQNKSFGRAQSFPELVGEEEAVAACGCVVIKRRIVCMSSARSLFVSLAFYFHPLSAFVDVFFSPNMDINGVSESVFFCCSQ